MKIVILIIALFAVGCVTQQQVPVKKTYRTQLRNFNLESGYCPNNHQMINLPRNNGYALDPVFNPETYHRTSIENLR